MGPPSGRSDSGTLPAGFDRVLATWSTTGPIGYLEAEIFGGVGNQRSALWAGGELTFGPVVVDDEQPWPDKGSPISQTLVRLGVDRAGSIDEFDAVGLGEHRHIEDRLR
jgi:hypothetical protein